jgi:type II secretion system protein N
VKERYLKYLGPVGYPLFYLVAVLVCASLTFPYGQLKEHIVGQFNEAQQQSGGTQELQIDDMGGYWLSGVKLSGVALLSASDEPGKPPGRIDIDEATVRYQLLPMLIGHSDLNFDADAFGGEVSGSYDLSGKDKDIDVTLDSLDASKLQPLVALLGVPLGGKLGGRVRLTMPDGKASKASGSVSIEIKDVWVGDGKAKIKGALALPKIDVGTLTFNAEAKDGVLKITKLVAGGKDLDVQGDGRITMRELATDSLMDLQVRFKINDAYRNKSDITKSLFGAPGSNAPALFEMADPKIKQSKRPDGFYGWSFRGPLGRPEFSPAGMIGLAVPPPPVPQ